MTPNKTSEAKKKPSMVTFDNLETGEVIYMYGDPSKVFVVDTKLEYTIFMHEKGHDPIVSRTCLVKPEFEGRFFREPRGYTRYSVISEDDPIPKLDKQQFSNVLLERIKQVAKMCLGEHVVENMDLRSLRDHMTDSIIFSLRTSVMAEQLSERSKTVTFKYPLDWFQQLKLHHAPHWYSKKWPVKYEKKSYTLTFKEVALYPMLPSIKPDCGEVYFQGMFNYDYPEKSKEENISVTVS